MQNLSTVKLIDLKEIKKTRHRYTLPRFALCVLLCVSILCANITFAAAEPVAATRGQASELVLAHGLKYNPGLSKSDIIKGYGDGDLRENDPVRRVEFFVMLSRAFGELPAPKGGLRIMFPDAVSFSNVPDWAETDINNICGGQILTQADPLTGNVSQEEVMLIIGRIHALLGGSLKDDFYNAVNKEYLEHTVLMPGYSSENNFNKVLNKVDEDIEALVKEIISKPGGKNTPEQKITDFYKNYLNYEARNSAGIKPIEKYIKALKDVKTLAELSDVCANISEETVCDIFVSFGTSPDYKDSNNKILVAGTIQPSRPKDFYLNTAEDKHELYITYLENMLKIAGCFDEAFIKEAPRKVLDFEKKLAAFKMEPYEYGDPSKLYNIFTFDGLRAMFPNIDTDKLLSAAGYKTPDEICVPDLALAQEIGKLYREENFDLLKTMAIVKFVRSFSLYLSLDFEKNVILFNHQMLGIEGETTDEQKALDWTKDIFGGYLSLMYADKYFSKEAKEDIERMCREFIDLYKKRVMSLDWMSGETKQKAIVKLDTMNISVGYPDKYDTDAIDAVIIKSADEGGVFADNIIAIMLETRKNAAKKQLMPYDKDLKGWASYTVNAYYNFIENSINFPAGILQPPFYDTAAPREANLGGIGFIIAHEITHAFDNNGSQFDENGNLNNWWTDNDYEAFWALCDEVVEAYDGYEIVPGISNNGRQGLSENITDLGAMACVLSLLKTFEKPDYDAFFRANAILWRSVDTREDLEFKAANYPYSLSKGRVNVVVRNFDEFYETYGIKEGDLMYVPPEKRVGIW